MPQFERTAIYMRLSRDDEKEGESLSIENQRVILSRYVAGQGGKIVGEYVDDGWSGTDFNRPGMERMLCDAQTGKIDTIVVKDLSRFGRNYIRVGQYVDYIFPAYGIRFIALSDNIDTADRGSASMDMMPVMNVFNEWHAANTSKKIRAVQAAGRRAGKYTGWNYPYGYTAGSDKFRTAVVDRDAAAVVRRIFSMRAAGNSVRSIVRALTDEGIPNPASYFTRLDGHSSRRGCSSRWNARTVMWILTNPTYLGHTFQHKTARLSYKNHKIIKVPQDEWVVKENAHEAVIDIQLWNKVQAVNSSVARGRADKGNTVHALSGLLVCADCGAKLKCSRVRCNSGAAFRFICRTYSDLGTKHCSSHAIGEGVAGVLLLKDLQTMCGEIAFDEAEARQRFLKRRQSTLGQGTAWRERQLKRLKSRSLELDRLIRAAFEERVLGGLAEEAYRGLCERYLTEAKAVKCRIDELEKSLPAVCDGEEEYIAKLKDYTSCRELTREMCVQLVEFVVVGERRADAAREVHIYYKFAQPSYKGADALQNEGDIL